MDDIKTGNILSQEQKESNLGQDKTHTSSNEVQGVQTPPKSDILNELKVLMKEKSDLTKAKESDMLDTGKESQPIETANILQKDFKCDDKSTIDKVTGTNEGELPEQDEAKSIEMVSISNKVVLQEKGENESIFETIQISPGKDENKTAIEVKVKTESQSPKNNKNKSPVCMSDTNVVKSSEKDGNNAELEEMTETNEAYQSEMDENKSVGKEVKESQDFSSEINEKSASDDGLTETVVQSKSTELELPDGQVHEVKKSSKLPLKRRKLQESEKTKEEEEDKPQPRTLRSRPSEKEKKDEKNTNAQKRKDISNKSNPVPAKKAKTVTEEIPKKSNKRNLAEKDKTEIAVKRLRSAAQGNSQSHKQSQISSTKTKTVDKKPAKKSELKNVKTDTRNTKSELKAKKPEVKNVQTKMKNTKPELKVTNPKEMKNTKPELKVTNPKEMKNTKPVINSKKSELTSKTPEIQSNKIKKQPLRKKTQKTAAIPVSTTSPKRKVYNLNPGKVTNLGLFPGIKEKVNENDMKYLRYLYRILYDQWPPKDLDELKEEILNFQGYSFKKKSQDLQKREQVLKKMPDTSVVEICKILDLKVDSKENMISDIIKFLLKPIKIVISPVDPFDPSMQPVVKLEKVSYDEYLNKVIKKEDKIPSPVKRSKRERYPSTKLEIYDVSERLPTSFIKEEIKSEIISEGDSPKNVVKQSAVIKKKTPEKNTVKVNKESLAAKNIKRRKRSFKLSRKKASSIQSTRAKLMKLAAEIQTTKSPVKPDSEVENINIIPDSKIKLEPIINDVQEISETEKSSENQQKPFVHETNEDSSDITLSSDEAKQIIKAGSPRKRISHKRVGKPLRYFTKIKENVLNANFSALQRLHILLFGASDKADSLKGNILAFGGFPFLEGSSEWKQKEFLLSLLAQNTLREYLNILCIDYTDDDQKALIEKLMKFLAAPSENSPASAKKKKEKDDEKMSRTRKVLMNEVQVKRLEADLVREQRIMERERKLHEVKKKKMQAKPKTSKESLEKKAALTAKQTDAELLNALLQTVYKRRALKKAGVTISVPKKETLTRLGELANVKFLVVTANYSDLDVLHHLIYMTEANKAKVRKHILDFAGFNFAEDTQSYKDRMEFLKSLGYDISKRIAFLLGLCPFKTDIEPQDLNELIMYFLMHPCKSKQIPIRHLPQTFFRKDIPKEICQLMQKHLVDSNASTASPVQSSSNKQPEISIIEEIKSPEKCHQISVIKETKLSTSFIEKNEPSTSFIEINEPSTSFIEENGPPTLFIEENDPSLPVPQKAKKSFKSSCLPSVRKKGLSPSISTLPLRAPKPLMKTAKLTQPVPLSGSNNKIFLPAPSHLPILQKAVLKATAPSNTVPDALNSSHEVLIQQQTPDGQQKTYKLIKLPTTQAVHSGVQSVLQSTPQQSSLNIPPTISPIVQSNPITLTQPVQVSPLITGGLLPPGLIFFKGNPAVAVTQSLPSIVQPVMLNPSTININPIVSVADTIQNTVVAPEEEKSDIPVECEYGEDNVEELNPLTDSNPPTDEDLFNSIQQIIHSSDFENITLKNVIDRVSSQYSAFDLTQRHMYMKECIKKIIMGT